MIQSHLERRNDAKRKRLKYLAKKTMATLLLFVTLPAFIVGTPIVIGLISTVVGGRRGYLHDILFDPGPDPLGFPSGKVILVIAVLMLLASIYTMRFVHRKSKAIEYVPTVGAQIAALPDDAILVRGSDEPDAEISDLLRSANGAKVEARAELVRAHTLDVGQ